MNMLIQGGTVITECERFRADILVEQGRIVTIGEKLPSGNDCRVVDAHGKLVLPGAVDVHTHLAMPFGGTISADGYFAGTRAAACGGTTTVFDFVMQDSGERLDSAVHRRMALCREEAAVDYAFHVAIKDISGNLLDSMDDCVAMGVPSFKVFMVYDFRVNDGDFYQILEKSRQCRSLVSVHAENNDLVGHLTNQHLAAGRTSPVYHYLSRPEFVESEAVGKAIALARETGAALYIVHLACADGIEEVKAAQADGLHIFAETCPQYLEFTSDVYHRDDGGLFVCSPPMKGEHSRQSLWRALNNNHVSVVATDHCPFLLSEKAWGKDDFTKTPNGCSGIEVLYPYMLARANIGHISFEQAVKVCASNPARIFGCPSKGGLAPGKDADIVIYDPEIDFVITQDKMHSDSDHTIWEGVSLRGYPVQTYSRGRLVYDHGAFVGEKGWGRFLERRLEYLPKVSPPPHDGAEGTHYFR
ncbi:dihydropyrimidinase [Desulfovibrio sp. OttesenSCG-928-G15]|nr:dihydropyrimidinase [Desulfovibrio sp. OttesenSCG-928-G15]